MITINQKSIIDKHTQNKQTYKKTERNPNVILKIVLTSQEKRIKKERNTRN